MLAAKFAVSGPADGVLRHDGQMIGLKMVDQTGFHGIVAEGLEDLVDLNGIPGHFDQRDLKQAVAQIHVVAGNVGETAHGFGVGDQPYRELIPDIDILCLYNGLISPDIAQGHGAPDNIGKMSQGILELLRRIIRGLCKQAEAGYISKIVLLIEPSDITVKDLAGGDDFRGFLHIRRDSQRAGKIIGGAGRDIANRKERQFPVLHHTGNDFVQGAVTAGTADIEIFILALPDNPPGVSGRFGRITFHAVAMGRKDADNIQQGIPDPGHTCHRIENE